MKGAIIYESRGGSTEHYAQWLSLPLRLPAIRASEVDWLQLNKYEWLIIGAPVYNGRLLVQEWLERYANCLGSKKIFLFIVSITPGSEPEKRMQVLQENCPPDLIEKMDIYWLPGRVPEAMPPTMLSPYELNPLVDAASDWFASVGSFFS